MYTLVENAKRECKMIKKFNNPENKSLMQIQHQYAKNLGFKNWDELIHSEIKGE